MWPTSLALIALAAWQPAVKRPPRSVAAGHTILLPAVFALLALGLLVSAALGPLTRLSVGLAAGALIAAGGRAAFTYLENARMLQRQTRHAVTDELTGLGNRRRVMEDLELAVERGVDGETTTLAFFDLDGFKHYNDSFGHAAGDALLSRLGASLGAAVADRGEAYRLGGDEFCVLLRGRLEREHPVLHAALYALAERGSGFAVSASCGAVMLPQEAADLTSALKLADERMYADKRKAGRSSHSWAQNVLMQLLTEREPSLHDHVCEVGELAVTIGRSFQLDSEELDELRRAAELHDIGKLALPDGMLHKAGPLDDSEQAFMRQHTIIGERILGVAPALRAVARLVRSSHERWDGQGYPDGLSGTAIPLGARIIAACDAYDAMVSARSYRVPVSHEQALAELARQAGTQFDPDVVEALRGHLGRARRRPGGGPQRNAVVRTEASARSR
jgi:diguanylate cyclase (GGDEF)-like protein